MASGLQFPDRRSTKADPTHSRATWVNWRVSCRCAQDLASLSTPAHTGASNEKALISNKLPPSFAPSALQRGGEARKATELDSGQKKSRAVLRGQHRMAAVGTFCSLFFLNLDHVLVFNAHCQSLAEAGWWRGIWLSCWRCTGEREKNTKETVDQFRVISKTLRLKYCLIHPLVLRFEVKYQMVNHPFRRLNKRFT